LPLEQATKIQRGIRDMYSFFNVSARCGGWSKPSPGHYTTGKNRVYVALETGWAPGFYVLFAEGICIFYMALIQEKRIAKLNSTEMDFWRSSARISRKDKIRNIIIKKK
jgi:hypothetical protein